MGKSPYTYKFSHYSCRFHVKTRLVVEGNKEEPEPVYLVDLTPKSPAAKQYFPTPKITLRIGYQEGTPSIDCTEIISGRRRAIKEGMNNLVERIQEEIRNQTIPNIKGKSMAFSLIPEGSEQASTNHRERKAINTNPSNGTLRGYKPEH
jgi:hypothetical protein